MNAPLAPVSAVIPCYRCAGTIDRAVRSIANQTLRPTELILVDDQSGDSTRSALEKTRASNGPGWIRLLARDRNGGPSATRNAGWEVATQPYLAFLDADDAWHPRKVELQFQYMRDNPQVAVSGHRVKRVRNPGDERIDALSPDTTEVSASALLLRNRFFTSTVMLKRSLPLRFPEDRRHMEDHLLWMQTAFAGHRVVRLDAWLSFMYKAPFGEGGLSANLWRMEAADLDNYRRLFRAGSISAPATVGLWMWSLVKFARRLVYAPIPALRERLEPP
jgi:glycosyltransferase involved in cell wall biosynthesis